MGDIRTEDHQTLLSLLDLEQVDHHIFRSRTSGFGIRRIYGGQLVAQALSAVVNIMDAEYFCHSLHVYFLIKGDLTKDITFEVDILRRGRNYINCGVQVLQESQCIMEMAVAFKPEQEGLNYDIAMPTGLPDPESLESSLFFPPEFVIKYAGQYTPFFSSYTPFDIRFIDPPHPHTPTTEPLNFWFRFTEEQLLARSALNRLIIAYISDITLAYTGLEIHGLSFSNPHLRAVSLDHALWFHSHFNVNEWILYSTKCLYTGNDTGLAQGHFFTQEGRLMSHAMQQFLLKLD